MYASQCLDASKCVVKMREFHRYNPCKAISLCREKKISLSQNVTEQKNGMLLKE
jgi:hypothetical protein